MCARDGLRRNTRHTPDQSCVRRHRQWKALIVVLSEIATGKREGKILALVDVRRAYFYAAARRKVFVELPPEDYQPGDEHMDCCDTACTTRVTPRNIGRKSWHRHSAISS